MSATDDAIVIAAILDVMREPPQRRRAPRNTIEALTGFSRGALALAIPLSLFPQGRSHQPLAVDLFEACEEQLPPS
jgi:hypothetical protein